MKTLEEKIEEIQKRWKELHAEPKTTEQPKPEKPALTAPLSSLNNLIDAFKHVQKRPEDMSHKIRLRKLESLRPPVQWYGNVVVGQDKHFPGWWDVVTPTGSVISYFGPDGEERAKEQATALQDKYK